MKTEDRKKYIVVALGVLAVIAAVATLGPAVYSAWQKRQLVERLKDVGAWNQWRRLDQYQTKIDLSGVNLRGANLGIDWYDRWGADLREADLRGADLRGADLCNAVISNTDFTDADLCEANLEFLPLLVRDESQSEIIVPSWRSANFAGANIYGIRNPPKGFIEHALKQGAIQEPPPSEKEDP